MPQCTASPLIINPLPNNSDHIQTKYSNERGKDERLCTRTSHALASTCTALAMALSFNKTLSFESVSAPWRSRLIVLCTDLPSRGLAHSKGLSLVSYIATPFGMEMGPIVCGKTDGRADEGACGRHLALEKAPSFSARGRVNMRQFLYLYIW